MILWFRFLDWFGSWFRATRKEISSKRKWGARWPDFVRRGRRYTRIEYCGDPSVPTFDDRYGLQRRPEPGWEFSCPNCGTYSLIKESDMPAIVEEWKRESADLIRRGFGRNVQAKPTAAMAGCPNCKYRPGDPE